MIRVTAAMLWLLMVAACAGAPPSTIPSPSGAEPTTEATAEPSPTASAAASHAVATSPNDELREELLAMMAEDQAVRTGVVPPGDDRTAQELFDAWPEVDADNALRMGAILDEFGCPGWSLVGEDGALAAWG